MCVQSMLSVVNESQEPLMQNSRVSKLMNIADMLLGELVADTVNTMSVQYVNNNSFQ